jgi:phosphoribosylanthranilate isomerase
VAHAIAAGADAVGFVFVPGTPRAVVPHAVAPWVAAVPPFVTPVALFVNASRAEVEETIRITGIRTVQFHGEETPEFCRYFRDRVKVIKAFRVRDLSTLAAMAPYTDFTDAWLLDAFTPGAHGGTGKTFDWDLAASLRGLARPLILAGGLKPENVGEAIRRFEPFGLDVSSGVESAPGKKNPDRVDRFIAAVGGAHFPAFRSPKPD